jgi:hypothetical protein
MTDITISLHGSMAGLDDSGNLILPQADFIELKDGRKIAIAAAPGAVAGTGVSVVESGNGIVNKSVITFTNAPVALADEAGVVAYGGLKVYDMPAGLTYIISAVSDIVLTKSSAGVNADWDGDFGVGTVTAGNNNALATTEQNIIPTTATPQAVAGVTSADGVSTAAVVLDGTTTAADIFVNLLVDDADHNVTGTACNLILNGTLTLIWINGGDK